MQNIDCATAAAKANTTRGGGERGGGGERAGVEREREREQPFLIQFQSDAFTVGRQADRQTDFRLG